VVGPNQLANYLDASTLDVIDEPWALPQAIDVVISASAETFSPDPLRRPSAFAQYLAYEPVIPFEESPLGNKSLAGLLSASGSTGAWLVVATGHPLLLFAVPAGIVLTYAATGIGEALQIGLRAKVLAMLGIYDDSESQASEAAAQSEQESKE
jgi:hypothetical protein